MEKTCPKCQQAKPLSEFPPGSSYCIPCKREYDRDYYHKTRERRRKLKTATDRTNRDRNRRVVWEYLQTHPCVDCGNTNPVVLEFDHIDTNKEAAISEMMRGAFSVKRLREEMAKCEVRCANCHRIRTSEERGDYRSIWA